MENEEKDAEEAKNKIKLKHHEAERRRLEELEKKKGKAAELACYSQVSPRSLGSSVATTNLVQPPVIPLSHASRKLCFNAESENDSDPNCPDLGQDSGGQVDDISMPRDKNHKKNLKKKLKKVKTRMSQRQDQFEEQLNGQNPPVKFRVFTLVFIFQNFIAQFTIRCQILFKSKGKLGKLIGDITRTCQLQSRENGDSWPSKRQIALDRTLLELNRLIGQASLGDSIPLTSAFCALLRNDFR